VLTVIAVAAVVDAALVLLFVALGRTSHDEGNVVSGTLAVAAPFLIALALGWVLARAWRQPLALRTGIVVWISTVVAGMVLRRTVFDRGTALAFVIVATLFTGLFLVGWRAVASRVVASRLVPAP
jgi:MFS-type transporter involved in bile tolerance (Atg22 family)